MNKKYILGIVIIIALILTSVFLFKNYYYSWRIGYQWNKFETEFTNYLKDDKYGGKTPEETYNMFIGVLKSGDIETASKYFYWEKQVDEQSRLQKMKDEGKLEEYVNSLPKWGNLREEEYWDKDGKKFTWVETLKESVAVDLPDGAGGFIKHTFEPGEYKQEIIFQINKQANIWKISS